MAILWCGGEDIDFPNGDVPTMLATAGQYRGATWARGFIRLDTAGQQAKSTVFAGGEITSGWLSGQAVCNAAQASKRYVGFGKSGTTKGIFWGTSTVQSKAAIFSYDGTTQTQLAADTVTAYIASGQLYKWDLELVSYGGSSTIRLYVDGVLVCTFTGDSSISGVSGFDSVFFYCPITTGTPLSEVIVATTDTRSMGLKTCYPDAAGDALWEGGAYTDIDELTQLDTDLVYTNSGDDDLQVNLLATPTGSFRVAAVMACARAYKSADGTPNGLALGVKSAGSYDYGSKQALTNNWFSYNRLMLVNPITTNEWTTAEIDALQLNLRSKT